MNKSAFGIVLAVFVFSILAITPFAFADNPTNNSESGTNGTVTPTPTPIPTETTPFSDLTKCYDTDKYFKGRVIGTYTVNQGTGRNYTVNGTVWIGNTATADVCVNATHVREYYCNSNATTRNSEVVNCDLKAGTVCQNGACVPSQTNKICTDTDGGRAYGVLGKITGAVGTVAQTAGHDYCWNTQTLNEYSCNNRTITAEAVKCGTVIPGSSCVAGRCVTPTPTPTPIINPNSTTSGGFTSNNSANTTGRAPASVNLLDSMLSWVKSIFG